MDDGDRVFLSVNDLGLERRINLAPAHGNGLGPKLADRGQMNGVFHGPEFQSLEVFRLHEAPAGIGEISKSIFEEGKTLDPCGLETVQKSLADGAVKNLVHVGRAGEEERQVHNPHV